MTRLTTDDHTCVLLLDDVLLRQVLGTRDADDRAMLVRLGLAAAGVPRLTGRLIGRGRHAAPAGTVTATADPRDRSATARHARREQAADAADHAHRAAA